MTDTLIRIRAGLYLTHDNRFECERFGNYTVGDNWRIADHEWYRVYRAYSLADAKRVIAAVRNGTYHDPTCAREVMRHADDSTAYLSERCTCSSQSVVAVDPQVGGSND